MVTLPQSFANEQNSDFKPKVNKIKTKFSFKISAFDDSTTLLRVENNNLVISEDNGVTWSPTNDINKNNHEISFVDIDPFHNKNRSYAMIKDKIEYYLTNDMGESWRHLKIDIPPKKEPLFCDLNTHPFKLEYFVGNLYPMSNIY